MVLGVNLWAKYNTMLFTPNKYTRWYYDIVNRAKSRELMADVYVEQHHVIPRSLGGSNTKDNIVALTAREHFVAHWLLTKMVTGAAKYKMWNAFSCMLYRENPHQERYKVSSRVFANIKSSGAKIKSEKFKGKGNPMFGKLGELSPHYGKKQTDEHIAKLVATRIGKTRSAESRAKQSAATKGRKQSQEHIEKRKMCGEKHPRFGYKMTPEEIEKRTATLKKNKLAKKLAQGELKFHV
jgi:hypothetical protein